MSQAKLTLEKIIENGVSYKKAHTLPDEERDRQIVALRVQSSKLMGQLLEDITSDPSFPEKTDLGRELRARLMEVRHAIARHQVQWNRARMKAESAAYDLESSQLSNKVTEFLQWARTVL